MKILYNPGKFNGGAPLSLLQYAIITQKNGNDVVAVGEFSNVENKYKHISAKIYDIPCFLMRHPIKSINSIMKLLKITLKEKPDIIHATSYGIVPSKFISILLGIPIMYSIAGGDNIAKKVKQKIFIDEKLIVYSEENKVDLLECGYLSDNIEVIPNRMNVSEKIINVQNNSDELRALLISRLDKGLINSVKNVIDLIVELSVKHNNLYLDIIGSGNLLEEVSKIAHVKNLEHGREIIKVHGFQENVNRYIGSADIVFGKGRSVLEAILQKKVSFIVGEDHKISRCSIESIPNLYKYNFSGRNIEIETKADEISFILDNIQTYGNDNAELNKIKIKIDKLYNIIHAEKRILKLYKDLLNANQEIKGKPLSSILFLLRSFWYGFTLKNE